MAGLPDPGVEFDVTNTALVVTDPQIDFLSPDGVTWDLVDPFHYENLATRPRAGAGNPVHPCCGAHVG